MPGLLRDVEVIPRPDIRIIDDLVIYWNHKRGGRVAPRAVDIVSAEFAAHIDNSAILDVLDGGADFQYRIVGPRIITSLGRDSTGQRLSALHRDQPEAFAKLSALFRLPLTGKCPIYCRGRVLLAADSRRSRIRSGDRTSIGGRVHSRCSAG